MVWMNNQENEHGIVTTFHFLPVCPFFICYHPEICSFLSNYSFSFSLHRSSIDLQEEGGRYIWGQGHLIATWEKNDVGQGREISNRATRRAHGIETKTAGSPDSSDSSDHILHSEKWQFGQQFQVTVLNLNLSENGWSKRVENQCQNNESPLI